MTSAAFVGSLQVRFVITDHRSRVTGFHLVHDTNNFKTIETRGKLYYVEHMDPYEFTALADKFFQFRKQR